MKYWNDCKVSDLFCAQLCMHLCAERIHFLRLKMASSRFRADWQAHVHWQNGVTECVWFDNECVGGEVGAGAYAYCLHTATHSGYKLLGTLVALLRPSTMRSGCRRSSGGQQTKDAQSVVPHQTALIFTWIIDDWRRVGIVRYIVGTR